MSYYTNADYNTFISLYKHTFNTAFPLIETKLCKRYIKKEPWVSTGLLTSLRTKYKLLYTKLRKPTSININN